MITPRTTRLVQAGDLHAFRRVIARLAAGPPGPVSDCLVIVPTRGAARLLARLLPEGAADVVTRDELYERLASRVPGAPRRLTAFERDSLMMAAAVAAESEVPDLSFEVRPGLVAEILRFYDQLRRQSQRVVRFEELMDETLGPAAAAGDRGAERLQRQTRFLAAAFRGYEQRANQTGADDEHALRRRLIDHRAAPGFRRVVVTVADWIADSAGLFIADFDLLARLPGLEELDVVSTAGTLASGFHARLRDWLPGLEEIEADQVLGDDERRRPYLARPPGDERVEPLWFTYRDREEELVAVARRVVARGTDRSAASLNRTAVVARRPLPYLYLAPQAFGGADIPWQATEGLPLAAEPTAGAVDVVLDFVESGFTREAIVAFLRSPHLSHGTGVVLSAAAVAALSRALSEERYLGGLDRLEAIGADWRSSKPESIQALGAPALEIAIAAARELTPLDTAAPASTQIRRLQAFLESRFRALDAGDPFAVREGRARVAIVGTLDGLAAAHAAHYDPSWTVERLGQAVRRAIGEQTFAREGDAGGLQLLDDQAARYGDFDDVTLIGLVENEWPEPPRRNIFYAASLLSSLGWPLEKDRRAAEEARFIDFLASAARRVAVSTFTLDDEALTTRSTALDDVPQAGLSSRVELESADLIVYPDDALAAEPPAVEALDARVAEWAALRQGRRPPDAPEFHGQAGQIAPRPWSVSALETYLACPFKFFAQHVLKLDEEPDDEETLDPRQRGLLMHRVFERFFRAWQAAGHRAITPGNLDAARGMFVQVVDDALADLPPAEAALERARLLGSPAAAGLGEAVFRMEAERPVAVVERLLEHDVSGTLVVASAQGSRDVAIRGKVDRVDLLADGTFRLVDYKLGWPPSRARALQLPIYGLSAERRLSGHRGREWALGEAVYLAFKGTKRVVPLVASAADRDDVMVAAGERLAGVLDGIERGAFPPSPDDVFRCETCAFSSVCRLDHVDLD